jgi:gas vesicle protein
MGKHNSGFGDMLLGMILGGVVGYAYAILSAPKSGRETREELTEKSRELREKAVETLNETRDKTGKLIETGRSKVEDTVARARERADDVRYQGEQVVHDKREDLSEGLRRAADSLDPETGNPPITPTTPSI